MEASSIVLAGGRSLRLGHDKIQETVGCRSLLEKVLDDRSSWITKAAESADCITNLGCTFQAVNEDQRSEMAVAIGVSKEIYTMLEPDDSAPEIPKDYVVAPVIELTEGGKK